MGRVDPGEVLQVRHTLDVEVGVAVVPGEHLVQRPISIAGRGLIPFHHAIVTGLATSRGQQKHPNEVGPNQSAARRSDRRVGQNKMPPDPATQTPKPLQNAEPEPLQLAEIKPAAASREAVIAGVMSACTAWATARSAPTSSVVPAPGIQLRDTEQGFGTGFGGADHSFEEAEAFQQPNLFAD